MKKTITYLGISLLVLGSCCKAVPPSIELVITDEAGNNILSSPTDSSWSWINSTSNTLRPMVIIGGQQGNLLDISSSGFDSGEDHYFYSVHGDIDTLNIIYEDKGFNCNLSTKVEMITYNGKVFEGGKKDAIHTVIKH